MTTFTYRDGIVASDSRATFSDGISPESAKKIIVSQRHGVVYAIAGLFTKAHAQIRRLESLSAMPWISGDLFRLEEQPGDGADTEILIVQHDGRIFYFDAGNWAQIYTGFYAGGSGYQAALAAMHMGASAPEAIRIASLCDTNTDDRVVQFDIKNLEPPVFERPRKTKTNIKRRSDI